jgi:hypothetical protein
MGANFWIFSPWYFWQSLTHPMEAARRTHGNALIGTYIMGGLICSQGHFLWNTCATDFGDLLLEVIQSINTIEHSIVLNNCKDCSPRLFLLEYKSTAQASDDQLTTKFFFALAIWTSLSLFMEWEFSRHKYAGAGRKKSTNCFWKHCCGVVHISILVLKVSQHWSFPVDLNHFSRLFIETTHKHLLHWLAWTCKQTHQLCVLTTENQKQKTFMSFTWFQFTLSLRTTLHHRPQNQCHSRTGKSEKSN